jgi:6-phosphogluconolactonase
MPHFTAYVSGYGPHILTISIDELGGCSIVGTTVAGVHPSYLACSQTPHPVVFAVDELKPDGSVASFSRGSSGLLTPTRVGIVSSAGADPCHVSVKDGCCLYVANYSAGGISVHVLDPDDGGFSVGPAAQILTPGPHPHQVVLDSRVVLAFVPVLGSDAVFVYAVEPSGLLLPHPHQVVRLPAGSGPRHIALHERSGIAVVINELSCTITSFLYDAGSGTLSEPQTVSSLPPGVPVEAGFSTAHVVFSPDGRFVYGSNRGHNSLVVCRVESLIEGKARLVPVQWHGGSETHSGHSSAALSKPRDFALSPDDGASLLVCANQVSRVRVSDGSSYSAICLIGAILHASIYSSVTL